MPGVEFFQTVMGHRFYEGTMPELVTNIEALTRAILELKAMLRSRRGCVDQLHEDPAPEMGRTAETCRKWFTQQIENAGGIILHRLRKARSHLIVRRPDGTTLNILTYVACRMKRRTNQVGFSMGSKMDISKYDWYVFIARPWGITYAYSREELELWRADRDPKKAGVKTSLSCSHSVTTHWLENKIHKMLGHKEELTVPPE